ncbi:MAG: transposase [Candidatus Staskawiczbacteria bacterium]|nr:transposase [Candidatus Staskawiczbacteria bacterium]
MFENLEQLQQELDNWLNFYNNERPHSGRYCYGKTPMQTFNESVILAKQKLLNNVVPAA